MPKVVVEPRPIPPHEKVILRYAAPEGTRELYRRAAKLAQLQRDVWVRDVLHRAARQLFEQNGVDLSTMPDAHFPKPPRIQPRYDLSDIPEESPWAKRSRYHAERKKNADK